MPADSYELTAASVGELYSEADEVAVFSGIESALRSALKLWIKACLSSFVVLGSGVASEEELSSVSLEDGSVEDSSAGLAVVVPNASLDSVGRASLEMYTR